MGGFHCRDSLARVPTPPYQPRREVCDTAAAVRTMATRRRAMLHRFGRCVSKPAISRANGYFGKPRRKVPSFPRAYGAAPGAFGFSENAKKTGRGVAGENGIVSGMAGRYAIALFELALE